MNKFNLLLHDFRQRSTWRQRESYLFSALFGLFLSKINHLHRILFHKHTNIFLESANTMQIQYIKYNKILCKTNMRMWIVDTNGQRGIAA